MVRKCSNTDAHRNPMGFGDPGRETWGFCLNKDSDTLSHLDCFSQRCFRQHGHEFLTTIPEERIAVSQQLFEHDSHLLKNNITVRVTIGVIKFLKVIDIKEDNGQRLGITFCASHLFDKSFFELPVVVKARQSIGTGKLKGSRVQTRVIDAHGGKRREYGQKLQLLGIKFPRFEIIQVKDTYGPLVDFKRHGDQRANSFLYGQRVCEEISSRRIINNEHLATFQDLMGQPPRLDSPTIKSDKLVAEPGMCMQLKLVIICIIQSDRTSGHIHHRHGTMENILKHFIKVQRGHNDLSNVQDPLKPLNLGNQLTTISPFHNIQALPLMRLSSSRTYNR